MLLFFILNIQLISLLNQVSRCDDDDDDDDDDDSDIIVFILLYIINCRLVDKVIIYHNHSQ